MSDRKYDYDQVPGENYFDSHPERLTEWACWLPPRAHSGLSAWRECGWCCEGVQFRPDGEGLYIMVYDGFGHVFDERAAKVVPPLGPGALFDAPFEYRREGDVCAALDPDGNMAILQLRPEGFVARTYSREDGRVVSIVPVEVERE